MWKEFWKSSIALGDIASWNVLMFLKIVTKWREIKKSKPHKSLTNWVFEKKNSHSILSRSAFLKFFICFAISWNFDFAVNLEASFSRQKTLKSKNKKHGSFWNTKFYHPAEFKLKKKMQKFSYLVIFCVLYEQPRIKFYLVFFFSIQLKKTIISFPQIRLGRTLQSQKIQGAHGFLSPDFPTVTIRTGCETMDTGGMTKMSP